MILDNHGYVFTKKKIFLMIVYFMTSFFFAHIFLFALKNGNHSEDLGYIQYCYTSRDKIAYSEIHLQTAKNIDDIKKPASDKYLYIKGTLPEVQDHKLVVRSLNGTAKVSVSGEELFNSISEKTLSGSSYITVQLPKNTSGSTVEILLYSPLSDSFEIEIIPAEETVFSASNIPFSFFFIAVGLFSVFIVSLILCLVCKNKKPRTSTFLIFASALLALAIFFLEYWPMHNVTHFLFNAKLFLWLLVPILFLFEIYVRFGEWNTKLEAVLAINILYALCIFFLWENVFFFILLYSGVLLQVVNLLLAMSVVLKQSRSVSDYYCSAVILFWGLDLLLWMAVAVQKITWQPIAFIMAVFFYCICNALSVFFENRKENSQNKQKAILMPNGVRLDTALSAEDGSKNGYAGNLEDGYVELKSVPLEITSDLKISNNCMTALVAFNQRIINKVYIREKHSLNVSEYSRIISSYMGMSRNASDEISRAAALHDIGKICIPEKVLFKRGRLTEDEFEEIKKHVIYGYKLLDSDDKFFEMAALVAKEHHEHVDGSGYMGLKGSEISLPAKIVAVADVFDALVSERSYKESWNFEEAFAYISEHANDYFDKDVVEAFVSARYKIYELYTNGFLSTSNNNTEERN